MAIDTVFATFDWRTPKCALDCFIVSTAIFESDTWPADIAALLDDHHLVAVSDASDAREHFAGEIREHLRTITDNLVITIHGSRVTSFPEFCKELRRYIPSGRSPRDLCDVAELLRLWPNSPRRLYFIWHDADVTLDADVQLFSRLVNMLFSIAVEHEHISPNRLMLQRAVFIGDSKLGAYAEDHRGQFSCWLPEPDDTDDEQETMFWEAQSCIERPPVLTYRIDG